MIKKAVIPAAGLGTRFLPATKAQPKEMLPIIDKPVIQFAVEEARAAGIEEFIFVTSRGKNVLEDHFDYHGELYNTLKTRGKDGELAAARRLIDENVTTVADEIISLDASEYMQAIQRMTDLGLRSGAVYDVLHVLCAEKASVDELRTFNGKDFRRMLPEGETELVVL